MKIEKQKGKNVLLDLEKSSVNVEENYLFKSSNKSQVLLKIKKVRNDKALAIIESGEITEPLVSYILQTKTKLTSPRVVAEKTQAAGGQVSYSQNTIGVKLLETTTIGLQGNGFLLSGFYQKTLSNKYDVLGKFSYNSIKVTSDPQPPSLCTDGPCYVNISYLDLEVLMKYKIPVAKNILWLGLGFDFLYAVDKSSNILDPSNIGIQQKLTAVLGFDWALTTTSYIPTSLEYGTFINKNSVTANQILITSGYGFRF